MDQQIGKITHYFDKIGVGVIEITDGALNIGDTIRVQGSGTDFQQTITSMQIDRQEVQTADKGQSIGLKVDQPVKEHDIVYKVA
ncbi:MAG: hypothetical protein WC516_07540 [Patescibacteria group bacterium]